MTQPKPWIFHLYQVVSAFGTPMTNDFDFDSDFDSVFDYDCSDYDYDASVAVETTL